MKKKPSNMSKKHFLTPAGSYAREVEFQTDIDILTTIPLDKFVRMMESAGIDILEEISSGDVKRMIIIRFPYKSLLGDKLYTVKCLIKL